jgi:hypothetical protein
VDRHLSICAYWLYSWSYESDILRVAIEPLNLCLVIF